MFRVGGGVKGKVSEHGGGVKGKVSGGRGAGGGVVLSHPGVGEVRHSVELLEVVLHGRARQQHPLPALEGRERLVRRRVGVLEPVGLVADEEVAAAVGLRVEPLRVQPKSLRDRDGIPEPPANTPPPPQHTHTTRSMPSGSVVGVLGPGLGLGLRVGGVLLLSFCHTYRITRVIRYHPPPLRQISRSYFLASRRQNGKAEAMRLYTAWKHRDEIFLKPLFSVVRARAPRPPPPGGFLRKSARK